MLMDVDEYHRILPVKKAAEKKIMAAPNVTGVTVGLKEINGEKTGTHAIVVFVEKKGIFGPEYEIPKTIDGVPTDVVEAVVELYGGKTDSAAASLPDKERYDPVQGGCSIGPAKTTDDAGTLGMRVTDNETGLHMWLTAYHVVCRDDNWVNADRSVLQPAVVDGGKPDKDKIGQIVRGYFGKVRTPGWFTYNLYVDCALVSLSGRNPSGDIIGIGTPKGSANAGLSSVVAKYGRSSGFTRGPITSTDASITVRGTDFYYLYLASNQGFGNFAAAGDSGAIVVNGKKNVIGMVMGDLKTLTKGGNAFYTIIIPIEHICDALKITID